MAKKASKDKPEGYEFGRPTDYDPKYCQMLIDYFNKPPYEEREIEIVTKSGEVAKIHKDVMNDFPTLAGFSILIDVDRDTLRNWAKKHKDFFRAYKRAKEYQENFLIQNAMRGLAHPAFSIFTAKNVIGWRDNKEDKETEEDELEFT